MGTGSLLAFPGSMVGALLAGILYKKFRKPIIAVIGEIIGTGILGALLAYPIAAIILGKQVALFVYIIPFTMSCSAGAAIAYLFIKIPVIRKTLINNQSPINEKNTNEI
jgi:energy coupling factor transporter S component ThiW